MTTQSKIYQCSATDLSDLRAAYAARESARKDSETSPLAKAFLAATQEFKTAVLKRVVNLGQTKDPRAEYHQLTKQIADGAVVIGESDRASDTPLLMAELEMVHGSQNLTKSFQTMIDTSKAYIRSTERVAINGVNGTLPAILPY